MNRVDSSLSPERSPTDPRGGSGTTVTLLPLLPSPSTKEPCFRTVATSSKYPRTSASSPFIASANWSVSLGCCGTKSVQSLIGVKDDDFLFLLLPPLPLPVPLAAAATAERASPTTRR